MIVALLLGCAGSHGDAPDGDSASSVRDDTGARESGPPDSSGGDTADDTAPPDDTAVEDADGDGYGPDVDCDDARASVHPGAFDACDGVDQDCDGTPIGEGACGEVVDFAGLEPPYWAGASTGASVSGGRGRAFDGGGLVVLGSLTEMPVEGRMTSSWGVALSAPQDGTWWYESVVGYWSDQDWLDHYAGGGPSGDFDGDGNDDLVWLSTGMSGYADAGIFVALGPPERWQREGAFLRDATDGWWQEAIPDQNFGYDLDVGHDIDGDGRTDVVVLSYADIWTDEGGSVDIVYGRDGPLPVERSMADEVQLFKSEDVLDHYVGGVAVGPDLDGDGARELLLETQHDIGWISGADIPSIDGHYLRDEMERRAGEAGTFLFPANHASLGDLSGDGLDDPVWIEGHEDPDDINAASVCVVVGDAARLAGGAEMSDTALVTACNAGRGVGVDEKDAITDYDVDGDGLLDMLVESQEGNTATYEFGWVTSGRLRDGGTQSIQDLGPFWSSPTTRWPTAADLDGDGLPEIVLSDDEWSSDTLEEVGRVMVLPGFEIPWDDPTRW